MVDLICFFTVLPVMIYLSWCVFNLKIKEALSDPAEGFDQHSDQWTSRLKQPIEFWITITLASSLGIGLTTVFLVTLVRIVVQLVRYPP